MKPMRFLLPAMVLMGALVLTGCTPPPNAEPVVIEQPVDAFNAVGQPYTPSDGHYGSSLSTDVERLQDAHLLYENARVRPQHDGREETIDRSQQRCLQQSDSRRVPIKGGGAGAVYCEPAVE